jgi:hypothetical protein
MSSTRVDAPHELVLYAAAIAENRREVHIFEQRRTAGAIQP